MREVIKNPSVTLKELRESASESGVSVHESTISRNLHKKGLYGRVARKKPFLKETHKRNCLKFAKAHIDDTPEQWSKILWSDETKIELSGVNQKKYVWRKTGEEFDPSKMMPTVKHGGGTTGRGSSLSAEVKDFTSLLKAWERCHL